METRERLPPCHYRSFSNTMKKHYTVLSLSLRYRKDPDLNLPPPLPQSTVCSYASVYGQNLD